MADIKRKDSIKRTIKILDKIVVGTQKIKQEYVHCSRRRKECINKKA